MNDINGFVFYKSFFDGTEDFSEAERKEYIVAIVDYAFTGELTSENRLVNAVFRSHKHCIDDLIAKASAQKENGGKGGRPKGNPKKPNETQRNPSETQRKLYKDKDKDKDNIYNPPNPPSTRGDDGFDAFWSIYPKKVGKKDAQRAFAKVSASNRAKIVTAVEAQKKSAQWLKENGRYIPNPSTWLNQGRWDDELETDSEPRTETRDNRMAKYIAAFEEEAL